MDGAQDLSTRQRTQVIRPDLPGFVVRSGATTKPFWQGTIRAWLKVNQFDSYDFHLLWRKSDHFFIVFIGTNPLNLKIKELNEL